MVFLSPPGLEALRHIETRFVEATVEQRFTAATPERMIGDRAYDSDPLDERLQQHHGVQLIAPHKVNRRKPQTQDGRKLRRYCRRWKIERLFAWLHNFSSAGHPLGSITRPTSSGSSSLVASSFS